VLEIRLFDTLPSTQEYLISRINAGIEQNPVAVVAKNQTNGIGSRENEWSSVEGNLTVSILLTEDMLPDDLPIMSASLYFGFLMKRVISSLVDGVWLKWPNDLYLGDDKIGGVITRKTDEKIVVGIGINLKKSEKNYASLQSDIEPLILLNMFLKEVEKGEKWKTTFREYKIEFERNKGYFSGYFSHFGEEQIYLKNASINSDGSLSIGNRKVYSQR